MSSTTSVSFFSDMSSTTSVFFFLVKERTAFPPLYLNFFLTKALTDQIYLQAYLFRFNLSLSSRQCGEKFQDSIHVIYDCPRYNDLWRIF